MQNFVKKQIEESIEVKKNILENENYINKIIEISNLIINAYKKGNKVMICGNGGSAADSQHIAAEFVSKFRKDRKALPAIAMNTNTSTLTSIGNDYEYNRIFERQVEAFGKEGDVLIGISTSGGSKNISRAFMQAKQIGMTSVALLGKDGGENKNYADISFIVPSNDTPRVQESHIMIGHIICDIVEGTLFGE